MTTTFPTKEAAIKMGVYLSTGSHEGTPTEVESQEMESMLSITLGKMGKSIAEGFGDSSKKKLSIYQIEGKKGLATFGVGEFRDGWDLWLIEPKSGFMLRV